MPENNQTQGDSKSAKKTDRNPFHAAKSLFKRLPVGLRRIAVGALIVFLVIVAIAVLHPSLNERWKFGTDMTLNLLILLAIAVQAYIYNGQWGLMQDQLKALDAQRESSERLATTALRQFEITDRPWLAANVALISPLTFSDQGANLKFRIIAKNVGRSVAVNATISTKVVIPPLGGDRNPWAEVIAEQTRLCQNIYSEFMSYVIFPEGVYTFDNGFGLGQQELEGGRLAGTDHIQIYLVGCVDYQFSGHEAHHQTRFIYEVYRTQVGQPGPFGISIGMDVPLERLMLEKMIVGRGDYAD